MCAEGETGGWHSEVIFVSDNPRGPYEPAPNNPILTQRYLNPNRANRVEWAGHVDLVEEPDGRLYSVVISGRGFARKACVEKKTSKPFYSL